VEVRDRPEKKIKDSKENDAKAPEDKTGDPVVPNSQEKTGRGIGMSKSGRGISSHKSKTHHNTITRKPLVDKLKVDPGFQELFESSDSSEKIKIAKHTPQPKRKVSTDLQSNEVKDIFLV